MRSNKGGFTLIELMVVIAIIGILATVAINISLQLTERGHIKTLESDLNAAYKSAVAYFTDEQGGTLTLEILKNRGYVSSDGVSLTIVNDKEENLLITGVHRGVHGVYQVDNTGRIRKQ